jgi:hypothetical protein
MENSKEKFKDIPRLEEEDRYDHKKREFPYCVDHKGEVYDLRDVDFETGNAKYRMMSEARVFSDLPSYIEVDQNGFVVREWD